MWLRLRGERCTWMANAEGCQKLTFSKNFYRYLRWSRQISYSGFFLAVFWDADFSRMSRLFIQISHSVFFFESRFYRYLRWSRCIRSCFEMFVRAIFCGMSRLFCKICVCWSLCAFEIFSWFLWDVSSLLMNSIFFGSFISCLWEACFFVMSRLFFEVLRAKKCCFLMGRWFLRNVSSVFRFFPDPCRSPVVAGGWF